MAQTSALLLVILLPLAHGGFLTGDCELKKSNGNDVTYFEWMYDLFIQPGVPDTSPPGTLVTYFVAKNIKSITSYQSKYVNVILTTNLLLLTLKDSFVDFEEYETEPDIMINLDFQCADGTARIAMWATVTDTNNHAPRFLNGAPYTYTLPLPYPPGVPLACVTGVAAAAEDIDLSTTMLLFQVEGTDALRVDGTWKVGRAYHVNLTTTRFITAPFVATLRVTDNGEPHQTNETKLIIDADVSRSLPTFTREISTST